MEIEIIKDKYTYRYNVCPNCKSELKIKEDTIDFYYDKGYEVSIINCPCCKKDFMIFK